MELSSQQSAADEEVEDPHTQALGVKILSHFPSQEVSTAFTEWHLDSYVEVGFHKPSIHTSLKRFWDTFGNQLSEPRKFGDLEKTSKRITTNGRTPLASNDDANTWVSSFTGANTRWEMLGILYIGFCVACISMHPREFNRLCGSKAQNKSQMIGEMKECVEGCIELSKHSLNNLVCNLLFKHMMLDSVIVGDTGMLFSSAVRLKLTLVWRCLFGMRIAVLLAPRLLMVFIATRHPAKLPWSLKRQNGQSSHHHVRNHPLSFL
jgi:hypothetical protein